MKTSLKVKRKTKRKKQKRKKKISHMRRLLMQPPIAGNLSPGRTMSRARFARRAAVADP